VKGTEAVRFLIRVRSTASMSSSVGASVFFFAKTGKADSLSVEKLTRELEERWGFIRSGAFSVKAQRKQRKTPGQPQAPYLFLTETSKGEMTTSILPASATGVQDGREEGHLNRSGVVLEGKDVWPGSDDNGGTGELIVEIFGSKSGREGFCF